MPLIILQIFIKTAHKTSYSKNCLQPNEKSVCLFTHIFFLHAAAHYKYYGISSVKFFIFGRCNLKIRNHEL
jgi:hypothetical protein